MRVPGNSTIDSHEAGDWRFEVHPGRRDNRVRIINRGWVVDDRDAYEVAILAMNMYELRESMFLDFDYNPVPWDELMGIYRFVKPYSKQRVREIIPVPEGPKKKAAGPRKITDYSRRCR